MQTAKNYTQLTGITKVTGISNDLRQSRSLILNFLILILTIVGIGVGTGYFLRAREGKIPAGYTALSYINTIETSDKNNDHVINGLDYAYTLKRYGTPYMIANAKFGKTINSLEISFLLEHLGQNVVTQKESLLANKEIAARYAKDLVVANERTLQPDRLIEADIAYNKANPQEISKSQLPAKSVLGESTGASAVSTRSGGQETSGSWADSGRSIVPSVLGTVGSYTGSAGFEYPIALPGGPCGFAPSASLSYSSGSVDDSLPYDDEFVDKFNDEGNPVRARYYQQEESYTPFLAGYGFNVSAGGSIIRDTRQEKEKYIIDGEINHRFILNLPNGLSAQLKYNKDTRRWVSVPEGFIKIDHLEPRMYKPEGYDYYIADDSSWVITTSDGSKYFFGEDDLRSKIEKNGALKAQMTQLRTESTIKTHCDANHNCQEKRAQSLHHTITTGGTGIYNEFDIADLCESGSLKNVDNKCKKKNPALLTTKWLLKRIELVDGKSILYNYDTYQKVYGEYFDKNWDGLSYTTVDSYLQKISWNDGKYQVVFNNQQNNRPDIGGNQFLAPVRLSQITVETKIPTDTDFHLVHRYDLSYSADNTGISTGAGENPWKISLLTGITEFGNDGRTKTPTVSLKYKQYAYPAGPSGSTIYLDSINNGYGGVTNYTYDPFEFAMLNPEGDPAAGPRRVRVTEKRVTDTTSNPPRSYRETYDYHNSHVGFADHIRGKKISGREFLGHGLVDVRTYDFNSDKVLSHTRSRFAQTNETWQTKTIDGEQQSVRTCVEPNLVKGRPTEEITYNQVGDGSEIEAANTKSTYNYRLLDWDKNNLPIIKQDNLDAASKQCTGKEINEPYFVYTKSTTSTNSEKEDPSFLPSKYAGEITEKPLAKQTVKSENLSYDIFGNLLQAVNYGRVNNQGQPIHPENNRYTYGFYIAGSPSWLNNLPYMTYASNKSDCASTNLQCMYGRTLYWYDQFYGNFWKTAVNDQKPTLGILTQTGTTVNTDANHDGNHNDPVMSYSGNEYLRLSESPLDHDNTGDNDTSDLRRGGVIKAYGPKPNVKNVTDPASQITLLSQLQYDPFYKSLPIVKIDALGYKTVLEEYDYLLQIPKVAKTQINVSPERFAVARSTYDALGRAIAIFAPNGDDPSKTMEYPSKVMHYFDEGGGGLVTRSMSLTSQSVINIGLVSSYTTTDSFYDGLGKVRQTQLLSKKVDGVAKRMVADANYNAAGQQEDTFLPQLADPVTLPAVSPQNYLNIIKSNPPRLVTIDHQITAHTTYDGLNRPIEATIYDLDNKTSTTSKTMFMVNGQKSVSPKNIVSLGISDSLGRGLFSLVIDPEGKKDLLTTNTYGTEMIDKPTQTTIKALGASVSGGNTTATSITYDKSGQTLTTNDPSLGRATFDYDVLGHVVLSSRRTGENTTSTYDVLGRLTKVSYSGGEKKKDDVYTYDSGDNALGKLVSVSYDLGHDDYSYDVSGRQKEISKTIKDKTFKTVNKYNQLSQVVETNYPGNTQIRSDYDEEGVVQKTYLNGQLLTNGVAFDKFGKPHESKFVLGANTYKSTSVYDTSGRLSSLDFSKGADSIFNQKMQYNSTGELVGIADNKTDFKYNYDSYTRLTNATSTAYTSTYVYDPFGRMGSKSEKDPVTIAYNSSFPFFAPKSVSMTEFADQTIPLPTSQQEQIPTTSEISPTRVPSATLRPTARPTITPSPTRIPTSRPSNTPTIQPSSSPTPTPGICKFYPKVKLVFENPADRPASFPAGVWGIINDRSLGESGKTWEELNADDLQDFDAEGRIDHGAATIPAHRKCCTNKLTSNPSDQNAINSAYKVAPNRSSVLSDSRVIVYLKIPDNYEIVNRLCGTDEAGNAVDCKTTTSAPTPIPLPHDGIGNLPLYCGGEYEYAWVVQKKASGLSSLAGRGAKAVGEVGKKLVSYLFSYNDRGEMTEDDMHCMTYDRVSKLSAIKIKKDKKQKCSSNPQFLKQIFFYYDASGVLGLQEEFNGNSTATPIKRTYFFGPYEEEISN